MKTVIALAVAASAIAFTAHAAPTVTDVSSFAAGGAVSGSQPDSLTDGAGSLWVEYGNGADSTGAGGNSTIAQYSATTGAIQNTYTVTGLVDGLKVDPTTGLVWALQNNDGNATLSLVNPTTRTVGAPISYASPPYAYGPMGGNGRGYDDVAFRGSQVFLSYTNPAAPTDPIVQQLVQGHNPVGPLTTKDILINSQTGTNSDTDSLKTTPSGDLVLTSEGDGAGSGSDPVITLIHNPGAANQSVSNTLVKDPSGAVVSGLDDVILPGAAAGTLYVAATGNNAVYEIGLTGLDPNTAIVSIGGLKEIALVNLLTGDATPLVTGADVPGGVLSGPHGLDFIAAPEPAAFALLGFGLLPLALLRRR